MSVLIVDDDESSRELLRYTLAEMGVSKVNTAIDGRDALRQYDAMQTKPEVVLCDVFMPNIDGFELLHQLEVRQFKGGVVMVSGGDAGMLSLSGDIARAGSMQVLGTLTKPVSFMDLKGVLGSRLAGLAGGPA